MLLVMGLSGIIQLVKLGCTIYAVISFLWVFLSGVACAMSPMANMCMGQSIVNVFYWFLGPLITAGQIAGVPPFGGIIALILIIKWGADNN